MTSEDPGSTSQVVDEPLRLVLSPQEVAYIEERIARAKRQLCAGIAVPAAYALSLLAWAGIAGGIGKFDGFVHFVGAALVLSVFIVFGVTLHLLLSGSVDWIMFARYRRDHRAFLDRYNRL